MDRLPFLDHDLFSTNHPVLLCIRSLGRTSVSPLCHYVSLTHTQCSQYSWNHRCSSYPFYAIVSATKTYDINASHPVVRFYRTGETSPLFSYHLSGDIRSTSWGSEMERSNTTQLDISPRFNPALQALSYNSNSAHGYLNGSCTAPTQAGNSSSLISCLQGTFSQRDTLAFNLLTTNQNTTSQITLRSSYDKWQFGITAPPYVILHRFNSTHQQSNEPVLRTAVPNPQDCTQLKVCLAGPANRGVNMISPEVLAPLGVIMRSHAIYASSCISFGQFS